MTLVAWHPLARWELFESADFYEREVAGLGSIFIERVETAIERIKAYPRSGPRLRGVIRGCRVSRFPYTLVYRIDADRIFILAVAHQKRRPYYWASRK